jgi:hypothetical protein
MRTVRARIILPRGGLSIVTTKEMTSWLEDAFDQHALNPGEVGLEFENSQSAEHAIDQLRGTYL